ncbi:ornithine carbamoyltransferase [uncultured Vagococcus sp.]|uniref:ornithine carbamoyltransferase n=1 Tax=uncultured Vagococcus sp. TaxID=189676 RepID=UPI0037DCB659
MGNSLVGKSILTLEELTKSQIIELVALAIDMKKNPKKYQESLSGKILAMIFEKASTRTRMSFEAGIVQLGGHAIVMNAADSQIGRGEPIKDTANVMSGYVDGIMIRTFEDSKVKELAAEASIPVINGLTDDHHPCQVLADLMTIYEHHGKFEGIKLAYIGDGNNMAHSLMIGGAIVGMDVSVASPVGFQPKAEYVTIAQQLAQKSGAKIESLIDPKIAVKQADFVYTDVWTSMGWEEENNKRLAAFGEAYQVNDQLVSAAQENFKFLHCLPAHRGEEVTGAIIDGSHSVVYQEAENRLHAQKALMFQVMQ